MLPSDYNFSQMKFAEWVPYIANANNFRKYVISPEMRDNVVFFDYHMPEEKEKEIKKAYKGLRLRRNSESIFTASNKILVKMSSTPGEINCISALVDEEGYYPSHSFFVIISEDKKVSNYVLCALINSKIINAYVRRECVKRTLTTDVVRNIPVPEFSDMQINEIEKCYLNIKEAYTLDDKEKVEEIQKIIDNIIFDAFGLKQVERERIRKFFEVYTSDSNKLIAENVGLKEYTNVSGQVEQIDVERMYCTVCLVEFGEQVIKIEKSMPGWFLRQGAEFSAKYQAGKLFDIKPLVYSYLEDDEIFEILSNEISDW